jgi:hypothetical protein
MGRAVIRRALIGNDRRRAATQLVGRERRVLRRRVKPLDRRTLRRGERLRESLSGGSLRRSERQGDEKRQSGAAVVKASRHVIPRANALAARRAASPV